MRPPDPGSSPSGNHGGGVRLSVVVPAYNEVGRVEGTLSRIFEHLETLGGSFEVILVDDGSVDATAERALQVRPGESRFHLLRLGENRGKGAAVRAGVLAARGQRILFSDADLSTPIEDLARLEAALDQGADVAIGSRAIAGAEVVVRQPWYRQTMGKIFNLFVQTLVLPGVRDSQCGFKLFHAEAARKSFSLGRLPGFSFDVEVLYIARRLGYCIAEVPVRWYNSPASRVHPIFDSARMLRDLLRIRWNTLRGAYRPHS
jgi:dolichyl-phosphate beta-glucosyltransferase